MHIPKLLLLMSLLTIVYNYTYDGDLLVLQDSDLDKIGTQQLQYLFLAFTAYWDKFHKRFAQIYNFSQTATQLKQRGSPVKLAYVDSYVNLRFNKRYQFRNYPTYYFFSGKKFTQSSIRHKLLNGPLIDWIINKTQLYDKIIEINVNQYNKIKNSKKQMSIVYHGDIRSDPNADYLNRVAVGDKFNNYYWGKNLGQDPGTVEFYRNFAEPLKYNQVDKGIIKWIQKHERPSVVFFDEQTLRYAILEGRKSVFLLQNNPTDFLLQNFVQAANSYEGNQNFLFVRFTQQGNQFFAKFTQNWYDKIKTPMTEYLSLNSKQFPIAILDQFNNVKYVMMVEEPTKENILHFLSNYQQNVYLLNEQVLKTPDGTQMKIKLGMNNEAHRDKIKNQEMQKIKQNEF